MVDTALTRVLIFFVSLHYAFGEGIPHCNGLKTYLKNNNFMATVNYYIKRTAKFDDDRAEIQLRFSGNRSFVKRALTGIFVTVENWDAEKGMPRTKDLQSFLLNVMTSENDLKS